MQDKTMKTNFHAFHAGLFQFIKIVPRKLLVSRFYQGIGNLKPSLQLYISICVSDLLS